MKLRIALLVLIFLAACAPTSVTDAPVTVAPPVETATSLPARAEPSRSVENEATAVPVTDEYAIFSINVQDFAHPAESAAVLEKIIALHESLGVPVDLYLTDVMAKIYAEQFPALLERLKTSPVVAVSYHDRAPRPYVNNYDWLGLQNMSAEEQYQTILRYETHAVDPVTGQTTDEAGGYQYVASLIGYNPYAASSITSGALDDAVMRVFRDLGAQMTVVHGRTLNLGDTKDGLLVRPEHFDYMLFQHVGEDAASAFEAALVQAHTAQGGRAPYFVGVKMHDNDFFAEQSAWLTVYVDGGKRPNWNPSFTSPLISAEAQAAMWTMYEQTVRYVASLQGRVDIVNAPMILEMIQ